MTTKREGLILVMLARHVIKAADDRDRMLAAKNISRDADLSVWPLGIQYAEIERMTAAKLLEEAAAIIEGREPNRFGMTRHGAERYLTESEESS